MTRTRWLVVGASVAALVASALWVTAPVSAAGVGGGMGLFGQPQRPLGRFLLGKLGRLLTLRSELGVTGEQRAQFRQLAESYRPQLAPYVKTVLEKKRALRDAVRAPQPDEAAIRAAAADLGKAIGDAAVVASNALADGRKVLTPEQVERLAAFVAANDKAEDAWLREIGK